jgi:hypothetical protein
VSAPTISSFFDKAFDALEAGTIDARDDTTLSCLSLTVNEEGWRELGLVADKFLDLALAIHERCGERLGDSDGIPVVFGLAAFEADRHNQERG